MNKSRLLGAVCACITLFSTNVFAVDKFWICGDGSWDNGSCWNAPGQPINGEDVFLIQYGQNRYLQQFTLSKFCNLESCD